MNNATLFDDVAREYANFRPGYPPELFAWLARSCLRHDAVWDCGCGSGQAAVALTQYFSEIFATDVSPKQIAAAKRHPKVIYSVAAAERSDLPDASVDLVTVAQALHWFDVQAFYVEVRRVARPGALLAIWTYPRPQFAEAQLDRVFLDFYSNVVGPYWPAERRHVDANYTTLPSPPKDLGFEELAHPSFGLALQWSLAQVMGYVSSWSATAAHKKQTGTDPVPWLQEKLAPIWPAGGTAELRMPLGLRAARVGGAS